MKRCIRIFISSIFVIYACCMPIFGLYEEENKRVTNVNQAETIQVGEPYREHIGNVEVIKKGSVNDFMKDIPASTLNIDYISSFENVEFSTTNDKFVFDKDGKDGFETTGYLSRLWYNENLTQGEHILPGEYTLIYPDLVTLPDGSKADLSVTESNIKVEVFDGNVTGGITLSGSFLKGSQDSLASPIQASAYVYGSGDNGGRGERVGIEKDVFVQVLAKDGKVVDGETFITWCVDVDRPGFLSYGNTGYNTDSYKFIEMFGVNSGAVSPIYMPADSFLQIFGNDFYGTKEDNSSLLSGFALISRSEGFSWHWEGNKCDTLLYLNPKEGGIELQHKVEAEIIGEYLNGGKIKTNATGANVSTDNNKHYSSINVSHGSEAICTISEHEGFILNQIFIDGKEISKNDLFYNKSDDSYIYKFSNIDKDHKIEASYLKQSEITIEKSSNPQSGTKEYPRELKNNDQLVYDVAIQNKALKTPIKEIVVQDTIPTGLTLNLKDIYYYYDNNTNQKNPVIDSEDVFLEGEGQKLTFTIKQLKANTTIHFEIPTIVEESEDAMRYENTAYITSVAGSIFQLESQTTYHEKKSSLIDFCFKKCNKEGQALEGAQFVLYEITCKDKTHNHDNELLKINADGELIEKNDCFKVHHTAISDNLGFIRFTNLKIGVPYQLIEFKTCDDYVLPEGQWRIISNNGEEIKGKDNIIAIGNPPAFELKDDIIQVKNYKLEELPTTGGRGITRFMLMGVSIMMLGCYWRYRNKNDKG